MNINDYFLYNSPSTMCSSSGSSSSGSESPLAMIKFLNSALKQQHQLNRQQQPQHQQSFKKSIITNPHRPVSMYSTSTQSTQHRPMQQQHNNLSTTTATTTVSRQPPATVVKSSAHTSIQKLVKLDTDVLAPPPSTASQSASNSNYLIKYPVNNTRLAAESTNIYDEIDYSNAPILVTATPIQQQHQQQQHLQTMSQSTKTRLRNLSAKINCCFKSGAASLMQASRRSDVGPFPTAMRSISITRPPLSMLSSSGSSGVSLSSASSSSSSSSSSSAADDVELLAASHSYSRGGLNKRSSSSSNRRRRSSPAAATIISSSSSSGYTSGSSSISSGCGTLMVASPPPQPPPSATTTTLRLNPSNSNAFVYQSHHYKPPPQIHLQTVTQPQHHQSFTGAHQIKTPSAASSSNYMNSSSAQQQHRLSQNYANSSSNNSNYKQIAQSQQQIEAMKRLQELELYKFNRKQAMLDQQKKQQQEQQSRRQLYRHSSDSDVDVDLDDDDVDDELAHKLDKSLSTMADSGISSVVVATGGGGSGCLNTAVATSNHRISGGDMDCTASDATSNFSAYFSSSPMFSSSSSASSSSASASSTGANSATSLTEWSPFPKVKTCMIAQVKPLKQSASAYATVSTSSGNEDEPIYENLKKYDRATTKVGASSSSSGSVIKSKQYSVRDVFSSLKSLEQQPCQTTHHHNNDEDDLLCDKEVDFYLNRNNFSPYFSNFSTYLSHLSNQTSKMNNSQQHAAVKSCKSSTLSKYNNRPVALWEQLV